MQHERYVGFEIKALSNLLRRRLMSTAEHPQGMLTEIEGVLIGYLCHNKEQKIYQKDLEQGKRLTASEVEAVLAELEAAQRDYAALRDSSEAKDEALADLAQENARLRDEAGSKAYLMLDGIVGFNESVPEFGAGITVGARIGSDLMLEAGADYMIGGVDGVREFSLDNFQFRLGLGWMF